MPSAEVVATGIRFPEGPVWCPATNGRPARLVCTSVADGALVELDLAAGAWSSIAVVGGGANGAVLASDGGFLVTQNGGIDFGATSLYDDPPAYCPVTPGIQLVPTSGMRVIAAASTVSARRSSGSRSWTLDLPQERAIIWTSRVIAVRKLATRSAASSIGRRAMSSGSWVVIPTGQRPVWQW